LLIKDGKIKEAQEYFQQALDRDPRSAMLWYSIGTYYHDVGRYQDALALLRQAAVLDSAHAETHCNLAHTLHKLGQFKDALSEMRMGHELGLRRPDWAYPSANWVRDLEEIVKMDARFAAIQAGKEKPVNVDEEVRLAVFCLTEKNLPRAAFDFFRQAFQLQPELRDKPGLSFRYLAAAAAFATGTGTGRDANGLSNADKESARRQAFEWMKAELAFLKKHFEDGKREEVQRMLEPWFHDQVWQFIPKLPEEERPAWEQLRSEGNNLYNESREKK